MAAQPQSADVRKLSRVERLLSRVIRTLDRWNMRLSERNWLRHEARFDATPPRNPLV